MAKTSVTLYSDTFSSTTINGYESKDTTTSLINLLLEPKIYNDATYKRPIGVLGSGSDTTILIDQLNKLNLALQSGSDSSEIFDPLATYETDTLKMLMFERDEEGNIDQSAVRDSALAAKWEEYRVLAGGEDKLCDRKNYFGLTVPYAKKLNDPHGGEPLSILTATQDLCIYNVKYSHLQTLPASHIEQLAQTFENFIKIKQARNEEDILGDFWNPLLNFSNATLKMPEFLGVTLPLLDKRIGGGAYFSAKIALDSQLNELRAAIYVDVDAALILEFKLLDLDMEFLLSASDSQASRFSFYLYSIDPRQRGLSAIKL